MMSILQPSFYRAAWNADAVYSDEKTATSVCPSNEWIVTKRKKDLSRFWYHTKDNWA